MMRSTPDIRNSYIQGVRKKNYTAQNPCSIQTTNDRAMSRTCLFTGTSLWWTQRAHIMSLCMMSSTLAVRNYAVCHSFIRFKKKLFYTTGTCPWCTQRVPMARVAMMSSTPWPQHGASASPSPQNCPRSPVRGRWGPPSKRTPRRGRRRLFVSFLRGWMIPSEFLIIIIIY